MATKRTSKPAAEKKVRAPKQQTVGGSIIQGLKEAIAWTEGRNDRVSVTLGANTRKSSRTCCKEPARSLG